MFKIEGNSIKFRGKYGYMKITKLTADYFIYGNGCIEEMNQIQISTYQHLIRLIKKYNLEI
ncbi:MAG: hypothetical protein KKH98_00425 [Spirochaetes bacterium]|nr:hypothetical protein [Spirochaetota bacterium]